LATIASSGTLYLSSTAFGYATVTSAPSQTSYLESIVGSSSGYVTVTAAAQTSYTESLVGGSYGTASSTTQTSDAQSSVDSGYASMFSSAHTSDSGFSADFSSATASSTAQTSEAQSSVDSGYPSASSSAQTSDSESSLVSSYAPESWATQTIYVQSTVNSSYANISLTANQSSINSSYAVAQPSHHNSSHAAVSFAPQTHTGTAHLPTSGNSSVAHATLSEQTSALETVYLHSFGHARVTATGPHTASQASQVDGPTTLETSYAA